MKISKNKKSISIIWQINLFLYGTIFLITTPSIFNSIYRKFMSKDFSQWIEYKFESTEEKLKRHHSEAESSRYPGIPYIRNSPTATFLYVSESDIGYGDCKYDWKCSSYSERRFGRYAKTAPLKRTGRYSVILNNEIWCNWYQIRETNKNKLGRCDYSGKLVGSFR